MSLALEKFYEKDIIEYLEQKAKESNIQSDSVAERVRKLLEKSKEEDAEQEIRGAVGEYNTLSMDSIYKEINIKKIKLAMKYIEKYVSQKVSVSSTLKDLVESYHSTLNEEDIIPMKLTFVEEKDKQEEESEKKEVEREYIQKEKMDKIINNASEKLFLYIRKRDFENSVKAYMAIKKAFSEYPNRFMDDKKNVYNDLLAAYVQIQKLKNSKDKKDSQPKELEDVKDFPVTSKDFYRYIDEIKKLTKAKEFEKARDKILDLKQLINKVPKEQKYLREMLESKLAITVQRVELAKRV